VPAYSDLLWPTLQAAIALGGSASIAELDAAVIEREQLTPEQQSVLLSDGPQTVVQNRLAWARTYLKGMGLLTNSKRGVWAVTPASCPPPWPNSPLPNTPRADSKQPPRLPQSHRHPHRHNTIRV
jgi:restriction endonuclease Mrr